VNCKDFIENEFVASLNNEHVLTRTAFKVSLSVKLKTRTIHDTTNVHIVVNRSIRRSMVRNGRNIQMPK